jgi:hypothetical protein
MPIGVLETAYGERDVVGAYVAEGRIGGITQAFSIDRSGAAVHAEERVVAWDRIPGG